MDELEIQGQKYISSKRAAKLTGYTKDYVGQLARAGKIIAQRVGRAWYVSETDIKKHAGIGEVQPEPQPQPARETPVPTAEGPQQHPPTPDKPTYPLHRLSTRHERPDMLRTWNSIVYQEDEHALLPPLRHGEPPQETHDIAIKKIHTPRRSASAGTSTPARPQPSARTHAPSRVSDGIRIQHRPVTASKTRIAHSSVKKQFGVIAGAVIVLVLAVALSGAIVPRQSHFVLGIPSANVATVDGALGPIVEYFVVIFDAGIALLGNFIATLSNSFSSFVQTGIDFIFNLL